MSYRTLGLRDEEFDAIVEGLGREPNETELHLFSVMWSEHCSYKSTRRLLRLFPKEGKSVVQPRRERRHRRCRTLGCSLQGGKP